MRKATSVASTAPIPLKSANPRGNIQVQTSCLRRDSNSAELRKKPVNTESPPPSRRGFEATTLRVPFVVDEFHKRTNTVAKYKTISVVIDETDVSAQGRFSLQMNVHLHLDFRLDRVGATHCWSEFPLLDRFDCLPVNIFSSGLDNRRILNSTLLVDC